MGLDMYFYVEENGEKYVHNYWRKANAIHKWFVDNCQGGQDDCRTHRVGKKKLEALRDICKRIIDGARDCEFVFETEGERGKWDVLYEHYKPCMEKNGGFKAYGKLLELCETLLPTRGGFFFGSLEYDESYFTDVYSTWEAIEETLKDWPDSRYYYQSSW